jgi:hypothetical protein
MFKIYLCTPIREVQDTLAQTKIIYFTLIMLSNNLFSVLIIININYFYNWFIKFLVSVYAV